MTASLIEKIFPTAKINLQKISETQMETNAT